MIYLGLRGFTATTVATVAAESWQEVRAALAKSGDVATPSTAPDHSTIEQRILLYIQSKGDVALIGKSPFPRKTGKQAPLVGDSLYDCYQSGCGSDRAIVAAVDTIASPHCPLCGIRLVSKASGRSSDRDHILPRAKFPEYSILRINLIKACDRCNDAKAALYADQAGARLFVHPYFDAFLGRESLTCGVQQGPSGELVLSFDPDPTLAQADGDLLRRHMNTLDLESAMAEVAMPQVYTALSQHVLAPGDPTAIAAAKAAMLRHAARLLHEHPNDPIAHALRAVANGNLDAALRAYASRYPIPP